MKILNTYRELMEAILEGKEVEFKSTDKGEWLLVKNLHIPVGYIDGKINYLYRIKPETKTVRVFNGVELPDCITESLRYGEPFYVVTTGRVVEFRWSGLDLERDFVKGGFAYLKREDAEIHHKALTTYEAIERPKE